MTKRDRLMLLAVLAVAMVGGAWMLLISPQRKAGAEARAQVDAAQQQLTAAQADLNAGKSAQEAYRRDRVAIVKLGRVVPESDDIPTLLVQLQVLAKRHKIDFDKYEMTQVTGAAAGAAVPATTPAPSQGTATTVPGAAGATEAEGPSSTDAVAPLYPPGSTEIAGGLGRTTVGLKLRGTYFNLERFLRSVQHFAVVSAKKTSTNGRLMIVDGFSYKPGETGSKLTAELVASVYFAPPVDVPSSAGVGTAAPSATPASGSTPANAPGTAAIGGVK